MGAGMQIEDVAHDGAVNLQELLVRVNHDHDLLRGIMELFTQEFSKLHLLLADSIRCGDLEKVQSVAHTLKGMLAALSINEGASSAMRIEHMAKERAPEGIPSELVRLEQSVAVAHVDLDRVCKQAIQ